MMVGNPTDPQPVRPELPAVEMRQDEAARGTIRGLPGMVRRYPCDFSIVYIGGEGHTPVHRNLTRPVPVHPVAVPDDRDVCGAAAVLATRTPSDGNGAWL